MLDADGVQLMLQALLSDNVDILVFGKLEAVLEVSGRSEGRAVHLVLQGLTAQESVERSSRNGRRASDKLHWRTREASTPSLVNFFTSCSRDLVALLVTTVKEGYVSSPS